MIISFKFSNYRSFRDECVVDFRADSRRKSDSALFEAFSGEQILPVMGFFGANGSGKTNILMAFEFFQKAIIDATSLKTSIFDIPNSKPFVLDDNKNPSSFEIKLLSRDQNKIYRYGFDIDFFREKLPHELLEVTSAHDGKKLTVIKRIDERLTLRSSSPEVKKVPEELLVGGNKILTISKLAMFLNIPEILDFITELKSVMQLSPFNLEINARDLLDESLRKEVCTIIRETDSGIRDLSVRKIDIPKKILNQMTEDKNLPLRFREEVAREGSITDLSIIHENHSTKEKIGFNAIRDEANGTGRMLELAPFIVRAIKEGDILIIDEIDERLHPHITAKIVRTFLDRDINKKGAQLIFTSHESFLMSKYTDIRKDEIAIVEKDPRERSHVATLADFGVRENTLADKEYLYSRYGGVPNISDGGYQINAD